MDYLHVQLVDLGTRKQVNTHELQITYRVGDLPMCAL